MEEDWLPLAEAAARFGVAPQTVRRWVREGRLPAERPQRPNAGCARVRLDDLRRVASERGGGAVRGEAAIMAVIEALRAELRDVATEQRAREAALRSEADGLRRELAATQEALRQATATITDLERRLAERDRLLEQRTRVLAEVSRLSAERQTSRLKELRQALQTSRQPWWRRLRGPDKP